MATSVEIEGGLKRNLAMVVAGFVLWMGFDIVAEILRSAEASAAWVRGAEAVKTLGMVVWALSFLQGWRLKRKMKRAPAISDALLHDEFAKYAEGRGFEVAFKITLATLGLLWLVSLFLSLSTTLVLQATIVVAVLAWAVAFFRARENPETA